MTAVAAQAFRPPIVYPESDGKPMAENTLQYEWIVSKRGCAPAASVNGQRRR
jgi:hypothetical protein